MTSLTYTRSNTFVEKEVCRRTPEILEQMVITISTESRFETLPINYIFGMRDFHSVRIPSTNPKFLFPTVVFGRVGEPWIVFWTLPTLSL